MLFAGLGSVRIVKNCDRGLENAARGRIYFLKEMYSIKGHIIRLLYLCPFHFFFTVLILLNILYSYLFSGKIKKIQKKIQNLFFIYFFRAVNWLTSGLICLRIFVIELAYVPCTDHRKKSKFERANKQVDLTQILDKKRCVKEQIKFELLYVSTI